MQRFSAYLICLIALQQWCNVIGCDSACNQAVEPSSQQLHFDGLLTCICEHQGSVVDAIERLWQCTNYTPAYEEFFDSFDYDMIYIPSPEDHKLQQCPVTKSLICPRYNTSPMKSREYFEQKIARFKANANDLEIRLAHICKSMVDKQTLEKNDFLRSFYRLLSKFLMALVFFMKSVCYPM